MSAAENTASASSLAEGVQELSNLIQNSSQTSKKEWWEKYLKHEIEFYGTPMANIRHAVKVHADGATIEYLRSLAWSMFRQPIAEQKLAAILILQEQVLPMNEMVASRDLPELVKLFDKHHIRDWNTTDWLCVRVLGKLIEQDGVDTARLISDWVKTGNTLWQRRAALVSFVNLAPKGTHADIILDTAAVLVQEEERFAQTGVGWVLRSLSDDMPDKVCEFLNKNKQHVSVEALRMATARLSDANRKALGVTGKRKRR